MRNLAKFAVIGIITLFLITGTSFAYKHELEKGLDFPNAEYTMKVGMATPPSLAGFRGNIRFRRRGRSSFWWQD